MLFLTENATKTKPPSKNYDLFINCGLGGVKEPDIWRGSYK